VGASTATDAVARATSRGVVLTFDGLRRQILGNPEMPHAEGDLSLEPLPTAVDEIDERIGASQITLVHL
jgi:hypothetical protein